MNMANIELVGAVLGTSGRSLTNVNLQDADLRNIKGSEVDFTSSNLVRVKFNSWDEAPD